MTIAFQIILLILIPLLFITIIGERKDKNLRDMSAGILFACLVSFIVSVLWL